MNELFWFFFSGYEKVLRQQLEQEGVFGVVWAIVKDGVVVVIGIYGVKFLEVDDVVMFGMLFRIVFLLKGVIGVIVGQLVDVGLIDWFLFFCVYVFWQVGYVVEGLEILELQYFLIYIIGLLRYIYFNLLNMGWLYFNILSFFLLVKLVYFFGSFYNYQNVFFNFGADMFWEFMG